MKQLFLTILILIPCISFSQESLSELLKSHNNHHIPYISVEELAMPKTQAIILDAREFEEYQVSHIKDAIPVGYNEFNLQQTASQLNNKQQQIVVYCTLGIRSDKIAEKLKKSGYTNVYNLYGGIFEWKNKGFDVYDFYETKTEKIHVFSPQWDKWLTSGQKVYN
ncbi:rhodanese-like domain-containing protein [Xanthomarina sp. GH4-25]|uniref:rhodanese-like domain-containing protein n=1 Tax=Xanthomarina sp. GH4-25 TaxID=3349335 RepID=UPI0038783A81